MRDAGSRNLQDIANLTSGLTITSVRAESQLAPTIRGPANLNVAFFLDGLYLANSTAIGLGLIAVERVEVGKGPVGAR